MECIRIEENETAGRMPILFEIFIPENCVDTVFFCIFDILGTLKSRVHFRFVSILHSKKYGISMQPAGFYAFSKWLLIFIYFFVFYILI